ncbi:MAG: dihydrodipicolinate synthase family protein [Bryobacteraceae bacterium]|nr:dihydrodipicolinate synthase family protein [Bryobacteraceae bacterium]
MTSLPKGVYAAAITPRRLGLQDINLGVMWELIDFLSERKVAGIALLGATGEFVHYSNSERMRVMGLAPKRSRVPMIVNVSHSNLDGAVELAGAAEASGAAGVLLAPPYFFRYSPADILAFYYRFRDEADIPIPTLLYNLPQFGNGIPVDVSLQLLREGVVQGIKDSAGSWDDFSALVAARRESEFTLTLGNDGLFTPAVSEGIDGVISGCACAVPELIVALDTAIRGGNTEVAAKLQTRLTEFIAWLDRFPTPVGVREAACLRGMTLGPNSSPASASQKALLDDYRNWFCDWLKDVLPECKLA